MEWTQIDKPASFSGTSKFEKVYKKSSKNFLTNKFTYQLHKPVRKKFPRRSVIVSGPDILWDVDLLDLREFQGKNFKNRYILTVIDVFSRKAYGQAMTNKGADTTAKAFQKILHACIPQSVRTDHGNEFKGEFNKLLKSHSINHILTSSPEIKANFVERFHRTFRDKLMRYMTYYSNENWTKVYQSIIKSYNDTPHRSLNNMAPNAVNSGNVGELLAFMLKQQKKCTKVNKFKIGDVVRITTLKSGFTKASKHTFTDELFRIKSISDSCPKTYKLEDMMGEPIVGSFYNEEIQKAEPDAEKHRRIEKATSTGKGLYKVKFKNLPRKYDSIITIKELAGYKKSK